MGLLGGSGSVCRWALLVVESQDFVMLECRERQCASVGLFSSRACCDRHCVCGERCEIR